MTLTLKQWDEASLEQRQEWLNSRIMLDAESASKLIARENEKRIGRIEFKSAGAKRER